MEPGLVAGQPSNAVTLASAAVAHLRALIEAAGPLSVIDGELMAGETRLAGVDFVDEVLQVHGFGCTIFLADVRIATTAETEDGSVRAVGTSPEERITQRVYRRGELCAGVTRTLGRDWVICYEPLRDRDDRIVGMLAAYRELDDYLDDLRSLDGTTEGILLQAADGAVLDANRAAIDMLRMSKAELCGKSISDFTVEPPQQDLDAALRDPGRTPVRLERTWRRSDGFEFAVELHLRRIERGAGPALLAIARDFTEQLKAREELRSLNAQLSASLRRLEEMQTRLVTSERLATVGNLVAGIAHEVNTPLGAITSSTATAQRALERLADGGNPERCLRAASESLVNVRVAATRIDDVVRMMRSFVRLDQADRHRVDLNAELDKAMAVARYRLRSGGRVVKRYGEIPTIHCDPRLLNQAFLALILNALQAVDGLTDRCVTLSTFARDRHVVVEVADDGEGIAAVNLGKLFDIAFTTRGDAPGLGLTIAKRVVEDHGGRIEVVSDGPGSGSTFRVWLPLDAAAATTATTTTATDA